MRNSPRYQQKPGDTKVELTVINIEISTDVCTCCNSWGILHWISQTTSADRVIR